MLLETSRSLASIGRCRGLKELSENRLLQNHFRGKVNKMDQFQKLVDALILAGMGPGQPGEKKKNTDIEHSGSKITLPAEPKYMKYDEAIAVLQRKMQQDEMVVSIHEEVDAFPLDGAHAFMQVLRVRYGWADAVPTPGFFGSSPPTTVSLEVGVNKSIQVIWGSFKIPGIDGTLETSVQRKDGGRLIFLISGSVKQKQKEEVAAIAQATREYLKTHSVYRGKAILLKTQDDGSFSPTVPPTFLDLSKVNEAELIFPTDTQEQVQTSLFTPI